MGQLFCPSLLSLSVQVVEGHFWHSFWFADYSIALYMEFSMLTSIREAMRMDAWAMVLAYLHVHPI